jgi:hypothetical protein
MQKFQQLESSPSSFDDDLDEDGYVEAQKASKGLFSF